jgi:transposase-like protein
MESGSKAAHKYRHHPTAFKREVVQASPSLRPGASVAHLAQAYGINANQIFSWRKASRDGTLQDSMETRLLAIQVDPVHPQTHLKTFSEILQADAFAGYNAVFETGRVIEAV